MSDKPLGMASARVDEVWHQFILFTRQYADFCQDTLGNFLHHNPKTSHTPVHEDRMGNFKQEYERTFGPVPKAWHDRMECWDQGCCD